MFKYPERDFEFIVVESKAQIRNKLLAERQRLKIKRQLFTMIEIQGKRIYVKCRQCKSQLRYSYHAELGKYKLVKFQNQHSHIQQKESLIQKYLDRFPLSMDLPSLRQMAVKELSISRSQFYYYWKKINKKQQTFKQLLNFLDEKSFSTKYFPGIQQCLLPEIFITASKEMISSFRQYGFCVSFDLTYGTVKQMIGNKKYSIGFILGRNQNLKAIPFAFTIINTQTTEALASLFSSFFEIMGTSPKTIITDMQNSISSSLEYLREIKQFQGTHLWDTFHYIRALSARLKHQKDQAILKCLKSALFSQERTSYNFHVQSAYKLAQQDKTIKVLEKFQKQSHLVCLSQIPRTPRWLTVSTSYHQQVHHQIKKIIKYEQPFIEVVHKLITISQSLQSKSLEAKIERIPFETIIQTKNLQTIRNLVHQKVYLLLLRRFIKSLHIKCNQTKKMYFQFESEIVQGKKEQKYYRFTCTCNILESEGLPCVHTLKVLQICEEDIIHYIDKRWLLKQSSKIQYQSFYKKGRPKKSRRNRIR